MDSELLPGLLALADSRFQDCGSFDPDCVRRLSRERVEVRGFPPIQQKTLNGLGTRHPAGADSGLLSVILLRRNAMSGALQHSLIPGPRADGVAILVRHGSRNLVQMGEVMHGPGSQQL